MFKNIIKILVWVFLISVWLFSSAFVLESYQKIQVKKINVSFINDNNHSFITKTEIIEILSSFGVTTNDNDKSSFNIKYLENKLLMHPAVKIAEIFFNNNGNLDIVVEKRTPIGRVISSVAEKNFYIDSDGFLMPLCSTYVAKVPLFSGNILLPEVLNFYSSVDLKNSNFVQKIYKMAKLINNDTFLKSQIVQIHIKNNGYFELIPRIGNQRILFGKPENMEIKLEKLKCFYTNGPDPKELNLYDTLNVMYNDQIVCSKII